MLELTYNPTEDYYHLLGLDEEFTPQQLKDAFTRLARELHSDVNPDPTDQERFKLITQAYKVLGSDELRQRYDELRQTYIACSPPALRLSPNEVDFGFVERVALSEIIVRLFNDGGEADVCNLTAMSGRFWTVEAQAPTDDDTEGVIGRLAFSLQVQPDEVAGVLEDQVTVFLEQDATVSAQKLLLRATLAPLPKAAAPKREAVVDASWHPRWRSRVPVTLPLLNLHPSTWCITLRDKAIAWSTVVLLLLFWGQGIFDWPVPLVVSEHIIHVVSVLMRVPAAAWGGIACVVLLALIIVQRYGLPAFQIAGGIAVAMGVLLFEYAKLTIMVIWWTMRASQAAYRHIRSS